MKKYDNYKDSGIEWIGEIPENWIVTKLKFIGDAIGGLTYTPNDIVEDESKGKLVLRSSNIQDGKLSLNDNVYVNLEISDKLTLKKGDILICSRNGSQHLIGKNICIDERTEGNTFGAFMMIFRSKYYGFLNHFFNSPIFTSQSGLFLTATINQLTSGTLNNFYIVIPESIEEQTQIANYLDHKTTQINNLISKKEQFITLLQEERTAIINQAVTKGLDPKVKMKDSGIEWLGEIPEHWTIEKLKFKAKIISKGTTPSTVGCEIIDSGEVRYIKSENIVENILQSNPEFYIDLETNQILKRSQLEINDVLIVIAGASIGKVAILTEEFYPSNTNQAVSFIRLNNINSSVFVWYWLQTSFVKERILFDATQSAQPNLSMESIGNFPIPKLSNNEEMEITTFLHKKTGEIDIIISKTQQEIELLKEYKIALISEVVTGKVDVRDMALN